jgi:hypothetical protein
MDEAQTLPLTAKCQKRQVHDRGFVAVVLCEWMSALPLQGSGWRARCFGAVFPRRDGGTKVSNEGEGKACRRSIS